MYSMELHIVLLESERPQSGVVSALLDECSHSGLLRDRRVVLRQSRTFCGDDLQETGMKILTGLIEVQESQVSPGQLSGREELNFRKGTEKEQKETEKEHIVNQRKMMKQRLKNTNIQGLKRLQSIQQSKHSQKAFSLIFLYSENLSLISIRQYLFTSDLQKTSQNVFSKNQIEFSTFLFYLIGKSIFQCNFKHCQY